MSQLAMLSDVTKFFGTQDVLDSIHWQIDDRCRVALVGRNGAGKTTLFSLLAGRIEPDHGTVQVRKGAVIATLEQDVLADDGRTLRDEAERGLVHLRELEEEFARVTGELASVTEGDPRAKGLLDRYAYLEERLHREGAYSAESRVESVLGGLHFTERDLDRPLAEFSGGQKNRAALARVLLRDPDLLLLDEPTNHLDLDAIEWLEDFLGNYQGAYMLVSHDRVFLNRLAREVVELRNHKLHFYRGDYDAFLAERERRLEDQSRRYEMQQEEIRRTEDFIRRNIVGQKTKQAQSRRNRLERMERIEAPEWPASSIRMQLPEPERSARNVVEARRLSKSYGENQVLHDLSFLLLRGQKVGLVGPNGVGKTTLLRLLVGQESQDEGTLRLGPGVDIGYYEQEQTGLRGPQSVLDEIWKTSPQATENEMRTYLGAFLFRGDAVFKSLNQLSGGERSRVALAKLVRRGANFLILDEPTNHLDLESRAVMEAALAAYRGTLLVASHDRAFLGTVVDRVLELSPGGAEMYEGGYAYYAEKRRERRATPGPTLSHPLPSAPAASRPTGRPPAEEDRTADKEERKRQYEETRRRRREEEKLVRRVAEAEEEVMRLERRKEELQGEMADPVHATDSTRLQEMTAELGRLDRSLGTSISEWERLAARLEALQDADNP